MAIGGSRSAHFAPLVFSPTVADNMAISGVGGSWSKLLEAQTDPSRRKDFALRDAGDNAQKVAVHCRQRVLLAG